MCAGAWNPKAEFHVPSPRAMCFPRAILDSHAMRRADCSMAVVSLPGLIIYGYLVYGSEEGGVEARSAGNLFEVRDALDVTLVALYCVMALEYALRFVSVRYSLFAIVARRLPPRGSGAPYPGIIRRWQSVYYASMMMGFMICSLAGAYEVAFWVYSTILLGNALSGALVRVPCRAARACCACVHACVRSCVRAFVLCWRWAVRGLSVH